MNHYQKLATVALRLLALILTGIGLLYAVYGIVVLPLLMQSNPLIGIPAAIGGASYFVFATGFGWILCGTILYALSGSLGRLIGKGM